VEPLRAREEAVEDIATQTTLFFPAAFQGMPERVTQFPKFRYMGSKAKLLPWIHSVISKIDFRSAWDPFAGSNAVAYLLKSMGKRVVASDFLNFPTVIGLALIENPGKHLDGKTLKKILKTSNNSHHFIEKTFRDIYYTPDDLCFLDRIYHNIHLVSDPHLQAIAMTALLRACLKKQPRGVFTITGDLSNYDDGRRDLRLSIEEHFLEQIGAIQSACFDNGHTNRSVRGNVFELGVQPVDLVYLDPPYVPRADDNCYIKRYHFLEGLSCYWEGIEIDYSTKTKKIVKRHTPFSYRSEAVDAFTRLFHAFRTKKIVLSYSSNGFPDLQVLERLMKRYKGSVRTFSKNHRYHFGTHSNVTRADTVEYLIVGQ
jgi:DNA adenine methylase/adenine-specific DNA-methyltransferase